MGNELAKKYDMPKTHSASGGHECLWKIYQATAKATGEQVSVFVLDIDEASKGLSSKAEKEQLLDIFRRDIRALKEMSHPNILKIHEVMEESKKLMAFVSERVLCSMSNALHRFKNLPSTAISTELSEYRLTEMELGRGISHLCDALQYSHYVARRLHLNISPDSIFITPQGVWKLAGFGMCITLSANEVGPQMQTLCPYYQQGGPPRRAGQYRLEPQLAYTPPEITQAGTSRIGYSADAFSLACVVHEAFQMPHLVGIADVATPLIQLPDHATTHEQLASLQRLHPLNMRRIPDSVQAPLERLLALEPTQRPEALALTQASFFHSGPVSTLRDLDQLGSKDPAGQATFLSSLADKLPLFTTRLQRSTVLPPVLAAANANPSLWLYAIPLVIKVSEVLSRDEFATTVQEGLKAAYSLRPPNPQVMFMLGQQTPLLLERAQHSFFIEHVYPMLLLGLESGVPQLQDQVVKQLGDEKMGQAVGHKRLLDDVLPRLGHIIVQTTHVSVRVNALVCLSKTHRYYGKQVLVDAILPTLKVCLDKDQNPAVVMCVLGCYDVILKELEPQYICTHVLPVLAPMVYLRSLTSAQFEKLSSRVSAMLQRAVEFRRTEISSKTGTTAAPSEEDGSTSPVSFMTSGNTNPATLSTAMANAPGPSPSGCGSTAAPADPMSMADWAWLKPLAASAASSATTLLANATNTLTTTVNGVVAKASSSSSSSSSYPNLDSGSGVRYDASSNPYQLPGTEFSLSKPPAPAPAPAPIDLSAYKPTAKPSYTGIGGGDTTTKPMGASPRDSDSTGRTKKFERQKSNPTTVPPLMPVTAPAPAPAPASSLDLDFMAGTNMLPAPRQPSSASLGMPPLPPSDGANMFTGLSPPRQASSSRPGFTRTAPVPAPSPALNSSNLAASLGPLHPIQASSPARTQPPNAYGGFNAGLQAPPTQFMAPLQPIYATPPPPQPHQQQQQQHPAYSYAQPLQAPNFGAPSGGPSGLDRMSAFDNLHSALGDAVPQAPVQQPYGAGGMAMAGSQQQQSYQQQQYQQQQPYQQQPYQQQPQQQQQQPPQQYGASGFDFMR